MELLELSRCEQIVMAEIWRQGSTDLRMLLAHLIRKGNEWKPQTVSTFLVRLVKKGYLKKHRQGRNTVYEPAVACSLYAEKLMEQYRAFCRDAGYTPLQEGGGTTGTLGLRDSSEYTLSCLEGVRKYENTSIL